MAYRFNLSDTFLDKSEQSVFKDHLISTGLDDSIWPVFESLFKSSTGRSKPLLLKVNSADQLVGAIILTRCNKYGKALFSNPILAWLIDLVRIPYYQWIKFGCCMDMMSNTGFVRDPNQYDEIIKAAIIYLNQNKLLTIVTDYTSNKNLYSKASVLPALPHATINCSEMDNISDYLKSFKNINRKMRVFENKGGRYIFIENNLSGDQIESLRKCFNATAEKSVFYLPYQDLYLQSAINTSQSHLTNVCYFIATLDDEFIGYQAALKTGKYLNALHGAFDRTRKSTYHAYDILFVKMTEYAIANNLSICDFGAVLNFTKQKMVNRHDEMSYFIMSKNAMVQLLFNVFLKKTKVQSKSQLRFRSNSHNQKPDQS